ncbi:hypothetical protein Tco_0657181 [Tanacetum coccineum]|uniref:Transposase (Putative), gypsy type n=1 Tax=Tanacetum coccineum TaxID=301880 RepID=A0ABQ4XC65_9ASTR
MGRDTIQLEDAVINKLIRVSSPEVPSEYGYQRACILSCLAQRNLSWSFGGQSRCLHQVFRICKLSYPHFTIPLRHPWSLPNSSFTIVSDRRSQKLEQSILLGRRENVPHRRRMAHKRPKGWDAIRRLLFRGRHNSIEHTPYGLVQLDRAPNPYQDMEDTTVASRSSGTPFALEKSPLDFANESPPPLKSERDGMEDQVQDGLSREILPVENPTTTETANAPPKVVEEGGSCCLPSCTEYPQRESLASIGLEAGSTFFTPVTQETPADAKSVSDPDLLSYAQPQSHLERDENGHRDPHWKCCYHRGARLDFCEESRVREIGLLSIRGRVARRYLSARVKRDQQLPPGHPERVPRHGRSHSTAGTKNLEALLEAKLSQQVSNLQAQVIGEEKIKAAFEEFKKYEDDKVEQRCAKMDARLDKLSVDFDEELFPHMLTIIVGRRWVIGHGLRLADMKCSESLKLSQAFANVVSAGLVKGMSEGLKHGIDHGKAGRDLAAVEAYDPEANSKDPWAFKEEFLLEDAIAANIIRAEKKKKCRVVCHTHGVGFAHHAKSDGIPLSVPIVASQGLAILLMDAATQTEVAREEGEPHPRLQRSISLPPFYNLECK